MYKESTAHLLLHTLKRNNINIQQPFYHATSLENGLRILSQGFRAKAGGPGNDAFYDNAVCFTRNFDYTQEDVFGDSQLIFVLDRNELKQRYKIYPYNWFFIQEKANSLPPIDKALFKAWIKGESRSNLIKILRQEDPTFRVTSFTDQEVAAALDNYIQKFKKFENTEKQEFTWEFEERVSTSNPLTDGIKETHIPPSYIKAILIKSYAKADQYFGNVKDLSIPVFYYNYKKKEYHRLNNITDFVRLPKEILSINEKIELASNKKTSPAILKKLFETNIDNVSLITALANNPNTPSEVLAGLAGASQFGNRDIVNILDHRNATSEVVGILWENHKEEILSNTYALAVLIENPHTSPEILEEIADNKLNTYTGVKLLTSDKLPSNVRESLEPKYFTAENILEYDTTRNFENIINNAKEPKRILQVIREMYEEYLDNPTNTKLSRFFTALVRMEFIFESGWLNNQILILLYKLAISGKNRLITEGLLKNPGIKEKYFFLLAKENPFKGSMGDPFRNEAILTTLAYRSNVTEDMLVYMAEIEGINNDVKFAIYENPKTPQTLKDKLENELYETRYLK